MAWVRCTEYEYWAMPLWDRDPRTAEHVAGHVNYVKGKRVTRIVSGSLAEGTAVFERWVEDKWVDVPIEEVIRDAMDLLGRCVLSFRAHETSWYEQVPLKGAVVRLRFNPTKGAFEAQRLVPPKKWIPCTLREYFQGTGTHGFDVPMSSQSEWKERRPDAASVAGGMKTKDGRAYRWRMRETLETEVEVDAL